MQQVCVKDLILVAEKKNQGASDSVFAHRGSEPGRVLMITSERTQSDPSSQVRPLKALR